MTASVIDLDSRRREPATCGCANCLLEELVARVQHCRALDDGRLLVDGPATADLLDDVTATVRLALARANGKATP